MKPIVVTLLLISALAVDAVASDGTIEPGAYLVSMRLELPYLEDMATKKSVMVCLTDAPAHGLAVLSDNNPLVRCPIVNVRRAGQRLTFDVKCAGKNQGSASAVFDLAGDRFDGAIAMKMGGKNMTMTERQSGHRIGACKP